MSSRGCTICGATPTMKWTLSVTNRAGVADLCKEHEAPLLEVLNKSIDNPAKLPNRSAHTRRSFEPLNWEPPKS